MAMTFREYLWQRVKQVKCPRISISHLSWDDKAIGALIGFCLLIVFGLSFTGITANKSFLLLFIGCPFLWLYIDYCAKRASGGENEPKK